MDVTIPIPQDPAIPTLQKQLDALQEQVRILSLPADSPAFTAAVTKWNANMLTFGAQVAALLADPNQSDAVKQDATYYDGPWVMRQIKDYTGDASWQAAIDHAHTSYRWYIDQNAGKIQAIWLFPHGLEQYGDLDTIKLLATNAAFAPSYPLEWTVSANSSREVAYNVQAKVMAVASDGTVWGLEEQAQQIFGHFNQWTQILNGQPVTGIPAGDPVPTYVRPFMAALSSYALIEWAGTSPMRQRQVRDALAPFWSLLWSKTFLAQQPVQNNPGLGLVDTLMYTNVASGDNTGGTEGAPDLNLLIAPVLAWLYAQTHDLAWRDKHDVLFIGGVQGGYLGAPKQFNQQYQRSVQGLKWRTR